MKLHVTPIYCNEKNMQNYAYLLQKDKTAIIIDAAESTPILKKLKELNIKPSYILTTHHHFDHVGGNIDLKQAYNLKIIAPKKEMNLIPGADIDVDENSTLQIDDIKIQIIEAPGHTLGHVLYYLPDEQKLFTGDVLFNLSIGGLFEGTPQEMYESLKKIKKLPSETEIFPGHEYTRAALSYVQTNSQNFHHYIEKMYQRENGNCAPSTLKEELEFNPYLQANTLTDFME